MTAFCDRFLGQVIMQIAASFRHFGAAKANTFDVGVSRLKAAN